MFPISRPTKKNAPTIIFFFFFFFAHVEKKKLIHNQPRTITVFIYIHYIICPYQFSDIVGLHRSFIYFQYGHTLTSQTKHISGLFRSVQLYLGLK